MPVERSKKTINAWAKFLKTEEGQEGLKWLREQRPESILSAHIHLFSYSQGQQDWHLRLLDIVEEDLPSHPKPPEPQEQSGLLPTQ